MNSDSADTLSIAQPTVERKFLLIRRGSLERVAAVSLTDDAIGESNNLPDLDERSSNDAAGLNATDGPKS